MAEINTKVEGQSSQWQPW